MGKKAYLNSSAFNSRMVTTFVSSFCSVEFAGEVAVGVFGMVGKEVDEILSAPADCFRGMGSVDCPR